MSTRVYQEFYCNDCPPPGGFIMAPLDVSLNHKVVVVCPKCGRKHPRKIQDGHIYDQGTDGEKVEEILVPKSAWSSIPRTKILMEQYKKAEERQKHVKTLSPGYSQIPSYCSQRTGVIIKSDDDLYNGIDYDDFVESYRQNYFMERWVEIAEREKSG